MQKQKMRMGKYISIAIGSLIFGILAWELVDIENSKLSCLVGGIMTIISFAIFTANIVIYSIFGFIKSLGFKNEKGLWKILTLVFRIGMLVFASLIAILFIIWMGFGLSWVFNYKSLGIEAKDASSWSFVLMIDTTAMKDWFKFLFNKSTNLPAIFITIFVFIMLWCAAGITFEVLKKFLGGYRPKKESANEIN